MSVLELRRGNILLGLLSDMHQDMFWCDAVFEPTDAFTEYRTLFEQEYEALNGGDMETTQRLQEEIGEIGLCLKREGSNSEGITDFMLQSPVPILAFAYELISVIA